MTETYTIQRSDGTSYMVDAAKFDAERSPPPPSTDPRDYPLRPFQFKVLVEHLGFADQIAAAIRQIPDPFDRAVAKLRHESATTYSFSDPLLQQARQAIGMSEGDLSTAWLRAKDIEGS